jgi:Ca-activated chloride channel family protein
LRRLYFIFLLLCHAGLLQAQYYIRGEVKDDKANPLQNVKIILHSTSITYSSGIGGAFGILSSNPKDSLSFSLEGYEPISLVVEASKYQSIVLKMMPFTASMQKHPRLSMTKNLDYTGEQTRSTGDETYNALVENDFVEAEKYPQTSVVLNVDKASYSNIRRFLNGGSEVPRDAVRIEEMLNYFSINHAQLSNDSLFGLKSNLTSCPWNPASQLLHLQVNARKLNLEHIPPSNLVFLIDVSGSMDLPNRLPLLKTAFGKLVDHLRDVDTVSIVVYGSAVGVMLPPTCGSEKKKILTAISELEPGGFTPGEAGIRQAYKLAQSTFMKNGNNRVILATDGDFNVGMKGEKDLEDLITKMKLGGVYLTCLGVGMGNYKDSKIEILAKKGNGNFAYIDNEQEAEKVLVKELTQTLYAVADDVYMSVNFNPSLVDAYRLIGFDNKRGAISDTNNVMEGGEVGSGHSMVAIFEIRPTKRSLDAAASGRIDENLATVEIHYRLPEKKDLHFFHGQCAYNYLEFREAEPYLRFATSVALFGSMLHMSGHVRNVTWEQELTLTRENMDPLNPMHKEFYDLIMKAQKIYGPLKKRKRWDEE